MSIDYNQQMSVYHAIYGRRTTWEFKDGLVNRSAVERMLDAAVWAPNHRMTEPWRFVVIEKDSPLRSQIALLAYESTLERTNDVDRSQANHDKFLKPAFIVCAYSVPGLDEESTKENYAAVCCAAQNISLAGAAEGLGVSWQTGGPCRNPKLKGVLGVDESWDLVTLLFIGAPVAGHSSRRPPVSKWVHWS